MSFGIESGLKTTVYITVYLRTEQVDDLAILLMEVQEIVGDGRVQDVTMIGGIAGCLLFLSCILVCYMRRKNKGTEGQAGAAVAPVLAPPEFKK